MKYIFKTGNREEILRNKLLILEPTVFLHEGKLKDIFNLRTDSSFPEKKSKTQMSTFFYDDKNKTKIILEDIMKKKNRFK